MGNLNEKNLKEKSIELIYSKIDEIIDFFKFNDVTRTKPNNIKFLNSDKSIIKTIYPEENKYKLYIDILNFPALLRFDEGYLNLINETYIFFQIFFKKFSHITEKEKK